MNSTTMAIRLSGLPLPSRRKEQSRVKGPHSYLPSHLQQQEKFLRLRLSYAFLHLEWATLPLTESLTNSRTSVTLIPRSFRYFPSTSSPVIHRAPCAIPFHSFSLSLPREGCSAKRTRSEPLSDWTVKAPTSSRESWRTPRRIHRSNSHRWFP